MLSASRHPDTAPPPPLQNPVLFKPLLPLSFDRSEGERPQALNEHGRVAPPAAADVPEQHLSAAVPACLHGRFLRRLVAMYGRGGSRSDGLRSVVTSCMAPAWLVLPPAAAASEVTGATPPLPPSGAVPSFAAVHASAKAAGFDVVTWAPHHMHSAGEGWSACALSRSRAGPPPCPALPPAVVPHPTLVADAPLASITALEDGLVDAQRTGAVVVAAADAVKSLLLRSLDLVQVKRSLPSSE